MELLTAYYSVVRLVPDLIKDEPVNIGVVAVCPSQKIGICRFPANFSKLKHFMPDTDLKLIGYFIKDLKKKFNFQKIPTIYGNKLISTEYQQEYLEYLSSSLNYMFQITPPRVTLTNDLQLEVEDIYDQFISEERLTGATRNSNRQLFKTKVRKIFEENSVIDKVERNIKIASKTPFVVDFKYTNGRANFIQPLSFSPKDNAKDIYETAVVWQYNFKQVRKVDQYSNAKIYALINNGNNDKESSEMAREILLESQAEVLDFNSRDLYTLLEKIRTEAHVVNQ